MYIYIYIKTNMSSQLKARKQLIVVLLSEKKKDYWGGDYWCFQCGKAVIFLTSKRLLGRL
jgi:hypothetical protein